MNTKELIKYYERALEDLKRSLEKEHTVYHIHNGGMNVHKAIREDIRNISCSGKTLTGKNDSRGMYEVDGVVTHKYLPVWQMHGINIRPHDKIVVCEALSVEELMQVLTMCRGVDHD